MTAVSVCIQRYTETPTLPQSPFFYEGNAFQEGDAKDMEAAYSLRFGKSRFPVSLSRLRGSVARMISEGVKSVWINAEIGEVDLSGPATGFEWCAGAANLHHIARVKQEIENAGLPVTGCYGMMWPNPINLVWEQYSLQARHSLMGLPRNACIKLTLCENINLWLHRHTHQLQRMKRYCDFNKCRGTVFISPFDDGDPPAHVWRQTCLAVKNVCTYFDFDSCMWSDGGINRAPYLRVGPFVDEYLLVMNS